MASWTSWGWYDRDGEEVSEGVWLSDRPLIAKGGLSGSEPLFRLEISEDVIREYEWVNEPGYAEGYREWLVPAAVVNQYPREFVGNALDVLERVP